MKMLKKDLVVVTGAAGFIGSALCNYLSEEFSVIGLDNLSAGEWNRCNEFVTKFDVDISSMAIKDLENLFKGAKYVFHLAAVKLHNQTNDYFAIQATNIEGSRKVFEAAVNIGVKKIIFTSSLYAYGGLGPAIMSESDMLDPKNFYGLSKAHGESLLKIIAKKNNVNFAIARLFFIYGPNQFASGGYKSVIIKNIENALGGLPLVVFGDGEQSLDYVYIDDCVEILSQLATSQFLGTMNVSTGKPITISSLIEAISKISGEVGVVSNEADWTQGTVRAGSTLLREKALGKREMVSIEQGLSKTWSWAVNNLEVDK